MLIPMSRDEEDCEDLVVDDFFWLHERGVDLIFVFAYLHLFRKIYLNTIEYEHEVTWKSGVFTFIIFQVVVFFGLVLCCSHLSEITLTIAANIMHTFFFYFLVKYTGGCLLINN
jgi:quinol-cytochrome oxidoreductase complex cytochrome b subunit